jgi:cytochrome c oxidase subunit II
LNFPQLIRPKGLFLRIATLFGGLLGLSACAPAPADTDIPSALDTRGPVSAIISQEWWIQFALGTLVFLIVLGLLLYILYVRGLRHRYPQEIPVDMAPVPEGRLWIWIGGVIVPAVILLFLLGLSMYTHRSLAAPDRAIAVTIEVIGHRWWWEVRYPNEGVVTANEIHIPVGEPVEILLTSRDVIHSFWVPQLAGKLDLNPGAVNSMWLQADEEGIYRGICAEFCGLQHANMQFMVVALPPESFQAWITRQQQPAPLPEPGTSEFVGQQVFLGSSCVYCHTVQGTNASGDLGPDLTHIASRLTLAAGILDNNRGNMGGWIIDPQHIKPGNLMPSTQLTGSELQALLDYLDSLE